MGADLDRLKTKRTVLASGLFDTEYYRHTYPDIRSSPIDALTHYLTQGEAEGRSPNPVFLPAYYRRHAMPLAPPEQNALAHYAEVGERLGHRPHPAFDPQAYLAAQPRLADFVDRPLFHYLKIGRDAGLPVAPGPHGEALARVLQAQRHADGFAASGRRDHHQLMLYKEALVHNLGVDEGFAFYRQVIDLADCERIRRKPIASLYDIANGHAAAFHEIAPAGELFVIQPPRVIGEGALEELAGAARAIFVACLIDARVRAHSGVIETADLALFDWQGEERSLSEEELHFDPAVFHAEGEAAWIIGPNEATDPPEIEEAFMLRGPRSDDFRHWMLDLLLRYLAASASGALPPVPVLIDEGLPARQRECLELMLPAGVEIVTVAPFASARVRRLWCAPSQLYVPLGARHGVRHKWDYLGAPPKRFAALAVEMARRVEPMVIAPTGEHRIYLAGNRAARQLLVNSAEIEAAAKARGFGIVHAEALEFAEQVRLFRHARFVIAQEISDLPLALFARPGLKLCFLSDPYPAELAPLTAALDRIGIDITVLTGPYARPSTRHAGTFDYRIDPQPFVEFVDSWAPAELPAASRKAVPATANVFSYWDKLDVTPIRPFIDHWTRHFPDFTIVSDPDIEPLIEDLFPQHLGMYRRIRIPSCRSDLARLLWLYETGGLYIDCHCGIRDADAIRNFLAALDHWELILYDCSRITDPRPVSHLRPPNGFLFARQRSPIIFDALRRAFRNVAAKYAAEKEHGFQPYWISLLSGAGALYEALLVDPEAAVSQIKPQYEGRVRFVPEGPGEPIGRDMNRSYRVAGMHWSEREERELLFD